MPGKKMARSDPRAPLGANGQKRSAPRVGLAGRPVKCKYSHQVGSHLGNPSSIRIRSRAQEFLRYDL